MSHELKLLFPQINEKKWIVYGGSFWAMWRLTGALAEFQMREFMHCSALQWPPPYLCNAIRRQNDLLGEGKENKTKQQVVWVWSWQKATDLHCDTSFPFWCMNLLSGEAIIFFKILVIISSFICNIEKYVTSASRSSVMQWNNPRHQDRQPTPLVWLVSLCVCVCVCLCVSTPAPRQ